MKCQEEDGCEKEAVGTDIQGLHLCREHLSFSQFVQRLCNQGLTEIGHPELIPPEFRTGENN
jgi:hypothetical protein